jgi:hypothetical protein
MDPVASGAKRANTNTSGVTVGTIHKLPNDAQLVCFIKGRALHDNYRTVQLFAKLLHGRRLPSVLLKIDWMSILLSTVSTRILLNGSPGRCICHASGLRQHVPLSPLVFVLTMDVMNALFKRADCAHLLTPLQPRAMKYRVFLYAEDMVVFVAPML